ncbi:hypothetical protein AGLY_015266 [Aphis glycines]|uniref:Uncharacterized protein n=1 Tax=Aphis glycines TaxID=307491 RepID=A0A6G0T2U7_APHGL|nr:hypothetical protein AGLY_015266 [Aphis glycines]
MVYLKILFYKMFSELLSKVGGVNLKSTLNNNISGTIGITFITCTVVGKWVPLCCTLGGGVDLGLGTTYKKPCIKFSRFSGQPKNFNRYLKKNYLEKLKISIFLSYSKIKNSILTKTGFAGAEVKNRSIFTAPNVVDRHKKKKKKHIIIKSIHSSLRSESKIQRSLGPRVCDCQPELVGEE